MSMEIYGVSVQTFMLISEKNVNAVSIGDSTKLNQLRKIHELYLKSKMKKKASLDTDLEYIQWNLNKLFPSF